MITLVVLARFGIPLAIPRYPLPAIVAALVLDAVDQTIFQFLGVSEQSNYQSYDKALDVYYLAIAYIATLRNWSNPFAFETGRFLWYYRLVGVALFELFAWRPMLLIFPNVFEYFFIFYSVVRLRWNPDRLTRNQVLGAAAFIWVGIKLPQEYWIHVAKLDTTDFFRDHILGAPPDASWFEALTGNLPVVLLCVILIGALALLVLRLSRRLPAPDWRISVSAAVDAPQLEAPVGPARRQPWRWVIEKVVLVGLLTVIFEETLPGLEATALQISAAVAFVVVLNSFVSYWLAGRGTRWKSTLTEFAVMAAVNYTLALAYIFLRPFDGGEVGRLALVFVTLLLTLIVTLYDHYRPLHDHHVRLAARRAEDEAATSQTGSRPANHRRRSSLNRS